jgi:hypothetical protein
MDSNCLAMINASDGQTLDEREVSVSAIQKVSGLNQKEVFLFREISGVGAGMR